MPSNTDPKTILLKGDPLGGEAIAAGTITPGMLIERTSVGKVQAHSVASVQTTKLIAREMEITDGNIDTDYSADDQTLYWSARSGDEYYMRLAAGENVSEGDLLESDGNGQLQAVTTGGEPLFEAAESVDNSATGATITRIKVRAL